MDLDKDIKIRNLQLIDYWDDVGRALERYCEKEKTTYDINDEREITIYETRTSIVLTLNEKMKRYA